MNVNSFKGYASSSNVEILNSSNPELQFKNTEFSIKNKLKQLLTEPRAFKFVATLVLVFKKIKSGDKAKYDTFYLNSRAEIIINESDIENVFEWIYITSNQRYKNI